MTETPPAPRRRILAAVAVGVGILLAGAAAVSLVGALAIADEPGRSLGVLPVTVDIGTLPAPPPSPGPDSTPGPSDTPATTEPELVPAPAPVVLDDHGGKSSPEDGGTRGRGSSSTQGAD